MEEAGLIPIRMTRITSNDDAPIIYLPKEARRLLGLEIGTPVVIYVDVRNHTLIIKRVEGLLKEGNGNHPAEVEKV